MEIACTSCGVFQILGTSIAVAEKLVSLYNDHRDLQRLIDRKGIQIAIVESKLRAYEGTLRDLEKYGVAEDFDRASKAIGRAQKEVLLALNAEQLERDVLDGYGRLKRLCRHRILGGRLTVLGEELLETFDLICGLEQSLTLDVTVKNYVLLRRLSERSTQNPTGEIQAIKDTEEHFLETHKGDLEKPEDLLRVGKDQDNLEHKELGSDSGYESDEDSREEFKRPAFRQDTDPLLYDAIANGDTQKVIDRLCDSAGPCPDLLTESLHQALLNCLDLGCEEVVLSTFEYLVKEAIGEGLQIKSDVVHKAVRKSHRLVLLLIQHKVDMNMVEGLTMSRPRPIHIMVEQYTLESIQEIFKAGKIDINVQDGMNLTPLARAAMSTTPNLALINWLIEKKARFAKHGVPETKLMKREVVHALFKAGLLH